MSILTLRYSCTIRVELCGQHVQSLLALFIHTLNTGTKRQLVIKCYTKIFKGVCYLHSLTTNT